MDLLALVNDCRYDPERALHIPKSDLETLWTWRQEATGVKQAAGVVLRAIDNLIAEVLDGGAVRMDDYLVKVRPRRTTQVMDPDTFWDYLGDDARLAFNANTVRLSSLKAIAKKRGQDPYVIVDSLIDQLEGEPALETVPISKAPKYAQGMAHGQVRRSK